MPVFAALGTVDHGALWDILASVGVPLTILTSSGRWSWSTSLSCSAIPMSILPMWASAVTLTYHQKDQALGLQCCHSVISIPHLGAQPWALNNTLVARLDGFNIRALRWIERVNWFQYVTNATIPFIPTRSKAKNASVQSSHLPTTASSHMNHPPPSWLDTSHRAPLRPAWHDNSRPQIGVAKPFLDGGGWWTWLALRIQSKSAK